MIQWHASRASTTSPALQSTATMNNEGLIDELTVQCKTCDMQMKRGHIGVHVARECNSAAAAAAAGRPPLSPLAWNTPLSHRHSAHSQAGAGAGGAGAKANANDGSAGGAGAGTAAFSPVTALPGWDSPEPVDYSEKKNLSEASPLAATDGLLAIHTTDDLHQGTVLSLLTWKNESLDEFTRGVLEFTRGVLEFTRGVFLGLTMLLCLTLGHASEPITCISSVNFLTDATIIVERNATTEGVKYTVMEGRAP
jgi:hypothetical protein